MRKISYYLGASAFSWFVLNNESCMNCFNLNGSCMIYFFPYSVFMLAAMAEVDAVLG